MPDDLTKATKVQRNQEPQTIDTTVTGTHPSGNLLTPAADVDQLAPRMEMTGLIWIEQEDQAKQGMARKGDMKAARAAPNHPYLAGEQSHGGRQ